MSIIEPWGWNCFYAVPLLEVVLKAGTHVMAPKETNPSNELRESDLNLAQQSLITGPPYHLLYAS